MRRPGRSQASPWFGKIHPLRAQVERHQTSPLRRQTSCHSAARFVTLHSTPPISSPCPFQSVLAAARMARRHLTNVRRAFPLFRNASLTVHSENGRHDGWLYVFPSTSADHSPLTPFSISGRTDYRLHFRYDPSTPFIHATILTRPGATNIIRFGPGPNGMMRTLGQYMLGSAATFG